MNQLRYLVLLENGPIMKFFNLLLILLHSSLTFSFKVEDSNAASLEVNTIDTALPKSIESPNACSPVSVPKSERCAYVKEHCLDDIPGNIDYISLYYCKLGSFSLILIVLILIINFISFGITAGEFLCPNLYTISKWLTLSDNVAGLTLLAFGNAAPDVLSIYKAISIGSGDLAISQLIGGTFFIISVIGGTVGILHPFQVSKSQFLTNLSFLLVVVLINVIAILSSLNSIVCFLLIFTYTVYVGSSIINQSIIKSKQNKLASEQRVRSNFVVDNSNELDDVNLYDISNVAEDDEDDGYNDFNNYKIPGSYGLKLLLKDLARLGNGSGFNLNSRAVNSAPKPSSVVDPAVLPRETHSSPAAFSPYRDDPEVEEPDENEEMSIESPSINPSLFYQVRPQTFLVIVPAIKEFAESTILYKIYHIVTIPITFVLKITTPVRDQAFLNHISQDITDLQADKSIDLRLDRLLLTIQTFLGINLVVHTAFYEGRRFWYTLFPITFLLSGLISWVLNITYRLDFTFSSINKIRYITYFSSIIGFMVSISWISILATETVSILDAIGKILNISDEILGITIFSIGNSTSDLISNITIASMGMPLMAYSACFGGPLLSLSSLGICGLILGSKSDGNLTFDFDSTLKITVCMLIVNILILFYVVPRNNWMIDKKIGTILVTSWMISTTLCVLIESV